MEAGGGDMSRVQALPYNDENSQVIQYQPNEVPNELRQDTQQRPRLPANPKSAGSSDKARNDSQDVAAGEYFVEDLPQKTMNMLGRNKD